jgi:hypothetical protein
MTANDNICAEKRMSASNISLRLISVIGITILQIPVL